jgi:sec-independent protein translocase protein TatA
MSARQALRSSLCSWRLLFSKRFTHRFLHGGAQMFEGIFQPTHLIVLAGIALLVFGPKKLPEFGKGLGEGIRGFKAAIAGQDETPAAKPALTKNAEEKA